MQSESRPLSQAEGLEDRQTRSGQMSSSRCERKEWLDSNRVSRRKEAEEVRRVLQTTVLQKTPPRGAGAAAPRKVVIRRRNIQK